MNNLEETLVSFDLDSTIFDTTHRQHMIAGRRDWPASKWVAYSMACKDDGPGPAMPFAQYLTAIGAPFVVASARDELARDLTRETLAANAIRPWGIFLRETISHEGLAHGEWKAQCLLHIERLYNRKISLHVDDWSAVAEETAKVGIPTMLVHAPGFSEEKLA